MKMYKMIEVDAYMWVRASSIRKVEVCEEEVVITFNGPCREMQPLAIRFEEHRYAVNRAERIIKEMNEEV